MSLTQTKLNIEVQNLEIGIAEITCKTANLIRAGDQDAYRMQHRLMRLQVCKWCLVGYDISSEILTDDEIDYILEQGNKVLQSCSP